MRKVRENTFHHKGLFFLILIFVFFVAINCLPLLLKDDTLTVELVGENEVFISSILPITDMSAREISIDTIQDGIIGYSEFSIEVKGNPSKPVSYEIYLTDIGEGDGIEYDYIKVYLTDNEDVPYKQFGGNGVPSYKDISVSLSQPDKRILLSDKINSLEVKKFKLRIWLADTYVLDDEVKEFRGKISVRTIS